MFAYYNGCDPLTAGWITAKDQLVPYMVLDKLQKYRGLPGLFLASACSGTLSTVSSGINSGTILDNLITFWNYWNRFFLSTNLYILYLQSYKSVQY